MHYITDTQELIIIALLNHPGSSYTELRKFTNLPQGGIDEKVKKLVVKGIVRREGKKRQYKLFASGDPYLVTQGGRVPIAPRPTIADPVLKEAAAFQLSGEQILYIDNHKHLSRSELARRLGIPKLELNFAMDRKGR